MKSYKELELESLTEQITIKIQPDLKLLLPGALRHPDNSVKLSNGRIAATFIRQAIYEKLIGSSNDSEQFKLMKKAIIEYNSLMAISKPSNTQRSKVNMDLIKEATIEALK